MSYFPFLRLRLLVVIFSLIYLVSCIYMYVFLCVYINMYDVSVCTKILSLMNTPHIDSLVESGDQNSKLVPIYDVSIVTVLFLHSLFTYTFP